MSGKEVVKVLLKNGFEFVRQGGTSHAIYRHIESGRSITVKMGKIGTGLLSKMKSQYNDIINSIPK